jgi:purine-binding chemotaxis protein CheW
VADILPPPLGGDSAVEHLLGVAEGSSSQDSTALLNFAKLLQSARQRAVVR